MKDKFLHFIDTTSHYEIERLFGLLPSDGGQLHLLDVLTMIHLPTDLFEAKAILLGRMGRHDSALEIYVYRLQDFLKAEECVKNTPFRTLQTHI